MVNKNLINWLLKPDSSCVKYKIKFNAHLALSEKECELWIKGLRHLVNDTITATYPLQVERWLRKEFYAMENDREM